MKQIEIVLKEFDIVLKKRNRTEYEKLSPPLSEDQIDAYLKIINVDKRSSFKYLYKWKDGYHFKGNNPPMFHIGNMLSLADIFKIQNYDLDDWEKIFLPIITSNDGDYLLFNNKKGSDYGKIYLYSVALLIFDPLSCYDSIFTMVKTTKIAYKTEIFKYSVDEKWLNIDNKKFRDLAKKLNPKSIYWRTY